MDAQEQLLHWAQRLTRGYDDVKVTDLTARSWGDGMAFCAILHEKGYVSVWDFADFEPNNAYANLKFAFETAGTRMGIPATLSVTEMGSESQMVTEKIMLYLAEWHRRLEDRAVDVDQLRQQMRVKKEEQRGDQNDEDSDEDESGGGSRFAPLIDSSDLVKQPAPKVGRPPVPAVPSISPRAALVGSSNALPSPQSSPRGSAASKAASLPTKGPPPRGPSPRPPARPAGDPPARPASDLSSCGTNSPLIATKIDDMARSTGSVSPRGDGTPVAPRSPRGKPSGSVDEGDGPRSPRWNDAQQPTGVEKTGMQLGGSRTSGRPEHNLAASPAVKSTPARTPLTRSGVLPTNSPPGSLQNSSSDVSLGRSSGVPPVPLPRKSGVDSPKPPPRGEAPKSPKGDPDTPKSPRAAPRPPEGDVPKSPRGGNPSRPDPPPKSPRGDGDAVQPEAPSRGDDSATAIADLPPKSPRKPMAGAVQLFGGEIKSIDLSKTNRNEQLTLSPRGGAADKPLPEPRVKSGDGKTSPRSEKPLQDPTAKSRDGRGSDALVVSPRKKKADVPTQFPPLVRVRLADGIVSIELVPGDDVEGLCCSIDTLELPKPTALVAISQDMSMIKVLPSDMAMTQVLQTYSGCSLFEMAADKRQWKAQRARFFASAPVVDEAAPKKRVFSVEVQLPGKPLEVIKVLLTEADTGATMIGKIYRKLREDESQAGSLILMEKGCKDYYVGQHEYLWAEVERRGTQAFRAVFRGVAVDDTYTVKVARLLEECAAPVFKDVEYRGTFTVGNLLEKIGAPARTCLMLVVTDLPERPLRSAEKVFDSLCMFHPEEVYMVLTPGDGILSPR